MDSVSPAQSGRDLLLIKALTCTMFFTFAMTTDAVGSIIPTLLTEFDLSLRAASAFHYVPMIAIAIGALALGFLADRVGRKATIVLGLDLRLQLPAVCIRHRLRLLRRIARRGRHRRQRFQDRGPRVDRRHLGLDA